MAAITSDPSRSALIYGEDLKGAFLFTAYLFIFTKSGISDLALFTVTQMLGDSLGLQLG